MAFGGDRVADSGHSTRVRWMMMTTRTMTMLIISFPQP